jgi:hypothetical protein
MKSRGTIQKEIRKKRDELIKDNPAANINGTRSQLQIEALDWVLGLFY